MISLDQLRSMVEKENKTISILEQFDLLSIYVFICNNRYLYSIYYSWLEFKQFYDLKLMN